VKKELKPLSIAALSIAMLTPTKAEMLDGMLTVMVYDNFCKPGILTEETKKGLFVILAKVPREKYESAMDIVQKDYVSLGRNKFCTGMAPSIEPAIGKLNVQFAPDKTNARALRRAGDVIAYVSHCSSKRSSADTETLHQAMLGASFAITDAGKEAGVKALEAGNQRANTEPNFCSDTWKEIVAIIRGEDLPN